MIITNLILLSLISTAISTTWPINIPQPIENLDKISKTLKHFKNYPPVILSPEPHDKSINEGEVPNYVVEFSPLVHLYTEEKYLPYDIAKYVTHFTATFQNGTELSNLSLSIQNISLLTPSSNFGSRDTNLDDEDSKDEVYLTSLTDFTADPNWITGRENIPNPVTGLISDAPVTLVVVDKGNGWVDAYWFYFYSFNLGPFVMGCGPYGNHVGDWEHSLVRFYKGEPQVIWMSAHGGGEAYYYQGIEKHHDRPIIYSARGTHANYGSVGQHFHDLPYGILSDFTDRGPLWDPAQNFLAYTFNGTHITSGNGSIEGREEEYGDWLRYLDHWGDVQLPSYDSRQQWSPWEYKYITGPRGPMLKNLMRLDVCERKKWWNFWGGCGVRKVIRYGVGIDGEGFNCGGFDEWFGGLFGWVGYGGWFCYFYDLIVG